MSNRFIHLYTRPCNIWCFADTFTHVCILCFSTRTCWGTPRAIGVVPRIAFALPFVEFKRRGSMPIAIDDSNDGSGGNCGSCAFKRAPVSTVGITVDSCRRCSKVAFGSIAKCWPTCAPTNRLPLRQWWMLSIITNNKNNKRRRFLWVMVESSFKERVRGIYM